MAKNITFTDEELDRAFLTAYFLFPDYKTALRLTVLACNLIQNLVKGQERRSNSKTHHEVMVPRKALLLFAVFLASDVLEREQEASNLSNPMIEGMPTRDDLIVRYIKYLIWRTTRKSLYYVAIGLGCLLYRYNPKEIVNLLSGCLEDKNTRRYKATINGWIRKRFEHTGIYPEGKSQMKTAPADEQDKGLVQESLRVFAPWGAEHIYLDAGDSILERYFDSDIIISPWQRKHILIDSECGGIERLVREYNQGFKTRLPDAAEKLALPLFEIEPSDDPSRRFRAPVLTDDMKFILRMAIEQEYMGRGISDELYNDLYLCLTGAQLTQNEAEEITVDVSDRVANYISDKFSRLHSGAAGALINRCATLISISESRTGDSQALEREDPFGETEGGAGLQSDNTFSPAESSTAYDVNTSNRLADTLGANEWAATSSHRTRIIGTVPLCEQILVIKRMFARMSTNIRSVSGRNNLENSEPEGCDRLTPGLDLGTTWSVLSVPDRPEQLQTSRDVQEESPAQLEVSRRALSPISLDTCGPDHERGDERPDRRAGYIAAARPDEIWGLISRAKQGNSDAMNELLLHPRLIRMMEHLMRCYWRDFTELDDLRQEICLRIWRYLGDLRPVKSEGEVRRWLYVISRNVVQDHLRRQKSSDDTPSLATVPAIHTIRDERVDEDTYEIRLSTRRKRKGVMKEISQTRKPDKALTQKSAPGIESQGTLFIGIGGTGVTVIEAAVRAIAKCITMHREEARVADTDKRTQNLKYFPSYEEQGREQIMVLNACHAGGLYVRTNPRVIWKSVKISTPNKRTQRSDRASTGVHRWEQFMTQLTDRVKTAIAEFRFHIRDLPSSTGDDISKYPNPTILNAYGVPSLVRFKNSLPTATSDFGPTHAGIYLHNGHTASESDGFADDFFDKGLFKDDLYAYAYAGIEYSGGFPKGNPRESMHTLWYHDHLIPKSPDNNNPSGNGVYLMSDQKSPPWEFSTTGSVRLHTFEIYVASFLRFEPFDVDRAVWKASTEKWIYRNDTLTGSGIKPVHIHLEEGLTPKRTKRTVLSVTGSSLTCFKSSGDSGSDYFVPPAVWPATLKQMKRKKFEVTDEWWKGPRQCVEIKPGRGIAGGGGDEAKPGCPVNNRFVPPLLGIAGRASVRSQLDRLACRRMVYSGVPDQVRVRVDGEERSRFDPRNGACRSFRISADSMFIEVRGDDEHGEILFAAFLVPPPEELPDGAGGKELVAAEAGYKVRCGISPVRSKSGEAHSHRVRITWEHGAAPPAR